MPIRRHPRPLSSTRDLRERRASTRCVEIADDQVRLLLVDESGQLHQERIPVDRDA